MPALASNLPVCVFLLPRQALEPFYLVRIPAPENRGRGDCRALTKHLAARASSQGVFACTISCAPDLASRKACVKLHKRDDVCVSTRVTILLLLSGLWYLAESNADAPSCSKYGVLSVRQGQSFEWGTQTQMFISMRAARRYDKALEGRLVSILSPAK